MSRFMGALLLGGLAVPVAFTATARASDPTTPRIGPEEGVKAKTERVLKTLPAEEAQRWRGRAGNEFSPRELVHLLLVEKDADYKAAVATFEQDGSNAEDFQKIVAAQKGKSDPLARALEAHATFFLGRAFLNRDEFEKACEAFDKVRNDLRDGTAWTDEATLFLGYSYARRPELEDDKERIFKARAKHCLEAIAPADGSKPVYTSCPERTRESAMWLVRELSGEGSGPLLELARRMETIEHQIDRERTGKPTQIKQEQVVAEIDRLIELMRQRENDGDG